MILRFPIAASSTARPPLVLSEHPRLHAFLMAFMKAHAFGLLAAEPTDAKAVLELKVGANEVELLVSQGWEWMSDIDRRLVARGVAHLLYVEGWLGDGNPHLFEEDLQVLGQIQAAARREWRFDIESAVPAHTPEPLHVQFQLDRPATPAMVSLLGELLAIFEDLGPGLSPLPEDKFADIGATALVHLEPNSVYWWLETLAAAPEDWQFRLERCVSRLGPRLPVTLIRYTD